MTHKEVFMCHKAGSMTVGRNSGTTSSRPHRMAPTTSRHSCTPRLLPERTVEHLETAAIRPALSCELSEGQTERQSNRLNMLKHHEV